MCCCLPRMRKPDLATCDQRDRLGPGEDLDGRQHELGNAFVRAAGLSGTICASGHVLAH